MAPSRNFRTTYYKTLGVPVVQHVVDVEASYQALFSEPVVNTSQLMKLALEVGIAPSYRTLAWKVLCGVLPAHKCLWEMAERERQQMYDDLAAAAAVLELYCQDECRSVAGVDDVETATAADLSISEPAKQLIRLYHTYRKDVLRVKSLLVVHCITDKDGKRATLSLEDLAGVLETVVADSAADRYWCFTRVVDVLVGARNVLDPGIWSEAMSEITLHSVESLFIRALDSVKTPNRP